MCIQAGCVPGALWAAHGPARDLQYIMEVYENVSETLVEASVLYA